MTHARVLSQLPVGEEMGAVNLGLWSEAERQMSITALACAKTIKLRLSLLEPKRYSRGLRGWSVVVKEAR